MNDDGVIKALGWDELLLPMGAALKLLGVSEKTFKRHAVEIPFGSPMPTLKLGQFPVRRVGRLRFLLKSDYAPLGRVTEKHGNSNGKEKETEEETVRCRRDDPMRRRLRDLGRTD